MLDTQELEKDAFELPSINPWRHRPSREQIRFAMDLCHSELPYAERVATIRGLDILDSRDVSELIDHLKGLRGARLARLRRSRRPRRR